MAVTATTVAAAATMLAAVLLTFALCLYIFLCAKRYGGEVPAAGRGMAAWLRFLLWGGSGSGRGGGADDGAAAAWCGLDEKSVAKLPCSEVAAAKGGWGDPPLQDCMRRPHHGARRERGRRRACCRGAAGTGSTSTCGFGRAPRARSAGAPPSSTTSPPRRRPTGTRPTTPPTCSSSAPGTTSPLAARSSRTRGPRRRRRRSPSRMKRPSSGLVAHQRHHQYAEGDIEMGLASGESRGL